MWGCTSVGGRRKRAAAIAHGRMADAQRSTGVCTPNTFIDILGQKEAPIPKRKDGIFSVAYRMWGATQWWTLWIRCNIRELKIGEAEDSKVLRPPNERKKRRRRHGVGDVERVWNPEEAGDSPNEGEVAQDEGNL